MTDEPEIKKAPMIDWDSESAPPSVCPACGASLDGAHEDGCEWGVMRATRDDGSRWISRDHGETFNEVKS